MPKDKKWWADYREKNREAIRGNARKWARKNSKGNAARSKKWREDNPEKTREQADRYRASYPERALATGRVRKAVFEGKLYKPNACSECKRTLPKKQIHGHHEDYEKWWDVIWLCRPCHSKRQEAAGG